MPHISVRPAPSRAHHPETAEAPRIKVSRRTGAIERVKGLSYDIYDGRGAGPKNIEHVFPRSRGGPSHPTNLFLADQAANSARGNTPFGEVAVVEWQRHDTKLGKDARGHKVFEPPDRFKGDVARTMFHVATHWHRRIPDNEEAVLRRWNRQDPPDDAERRREALIYERKRLHNDFVAHPEAADAIADF